MTIGNTTMTEEQRRSSYKTGFVGISVVKENEVTLCVSAGGQAVLLP